MLPEMNLIVINVYNLPHSNTIYQQITEFKELLSWIKSRFQYHNLIIVGDFNLPDLQWTWSIELNQLINAQINISPQAQEFLNIASYSGLKQVNFTPNSNNTFLDLVLVNENFNAMVSNANVDEILDTNTRHHNGLSVSIDLTLESETDENTKTLHFTNELGNN